MSNCDHTTFDQAAQDYGAKMADRKTACDALTTAQEAEAAALTAYEQAQANTTLKQQQLTEAETAACASEDALLAARAGLFACGGDS